MKAFTTIALLALLAVSASAAAFVVETNDTTDISSTKYVFSVMKGAITGYEVGMYKKTNYAVQANCLGPLMVTSFHNLYLEYAAGTFNIISDYVEVFNLLN